MPNLLEAHLRHAILYLQQLDAANDRYLAGDSGALLALLDFDHNQFNIYTAQKWLAKYAADIEDEQIHSNQIAHVILDLCNAYPDAGAYLISLRLGPSERIQWLKAALSASQQLDTAITTQAHLGNLGLAYDELGDFPAAIEHFEKALELAEQIGDRYHQGAWLGNLGNTFARMGDHQKAIQYHERHLALAREIKDIRGEGHALSNLGVSYAYLGDTVKSVKNYKEFLILAKKSGDRRGESRAWMNLGFAYYDMGDLENAERSFQSALPTAIEIGDKSTQSLILGGLADIHIERQEYDLAIHALNQAMEMLKESYDVGAELRLLQSLGNAHAASGDYQNALEIYTRLYLLAESVGAKAGMCSALSNQVSMYRLLKKTESAIETGLRGLDLAYEINSLSDQAFIHWQIGLVEESRGNLAEAKEHMQSAVLREEKLQTPDLMDHQNYLTKLMTRLL